LSGYGAEAIFSDPHAVVCVHDGVAARAFSQDKKPGDG